MKYYLICTVIRETSQITYEEFRDHDKNIHFAVALDGQPDHSDGSVWTFVEMEE